MLTILAFIFTIGLLVTVHEYGHFQVAKWCGVKVLKFSIGFGKPLWGKRIGQDRTEFVIATIPLGGYVKMLDEREFDKETQSIQYSDADLKRAFNRQSVFKRIAIVLAGPLANLLLAIFLYWWLLMMGVDGFKPTLGKVVNLSPAAAANFTQGETIQKVNGKAVTSWQEFSWVLLNESLDNGSVEVETVNHDQKIHRHQLNISSLSFDSTNQDVMAVLGFTLDQPDILARISEVVKNSPADLAGLKPNDLVLSVNQHQVAFWEDFVHEVRQHPNVSLDVLIKRNAEEIKLNMTPKVGIVNGKEVGLIGVAVHDSRLITTHYSAWEALNNATATTWDTSILSLKLMARLLTGKMSLKNMGGPVTIADSAGQSAQRGVKVFIGFLAFISISIGVMNLLPIPVLDGGHFMYYMVEILTGKPVSETAMIIGQKIGIFLLGLMMVIAFYNDINRLIIG
ncbi:MAG: RIP metalloprotease RseP [Methylotenera sp.]